MHHNRRQFLGSLGVICAALRFHAQSKAAADPGMDRSLAEAANNFLKALRPELRSKYGSLSTTPTARNGTTCRILFIRVRAFAWVTSIRRSAQQRID